MKNKLLISIILPFVLFPALAYSGIIDDLYSFLEDLKVFVGQQEEPQFGGATRVSPYRGGTGQDTSAWTGTPIVTAGVWSQGGALGDFSWANATTVLDRYPEWSQSSSTYAVGDFNDYVSWSQATTTLDVYAHWAGVTTTLDFYPRWSQSSSTYMASVTTTLDLVTSIPNLATIGTLTTGGGNISLWTNDSNYITDTFVTSTLDSYLLWSQASTTYLDFDSYYSTTTWAGGAEALTTAGTITGGTIKSTGAASSTSITVNDWFEVNSAGAATSSDMTITDGSHGVIIEIDGSTTTFRGF